jgi:hypothetical protein
MNNMRRPSAVTIARAAAGAIALVLCAGGLAGAQTAPLTVAPAPPAPPVATPSYATPSGEEQIRGSITAVTGKYTLQVRDDRGFIDNVTLHQGTIINPTGLTLATGMPVTISGKNAGTTFTANQIDAPYALALMARPVPLGFAFGFGSGWGFGPRYGSSFWW